MPGCGIAILPDMRLFLPFIRLTGIQARDLLRNPFCLLMTLTTLVMTLLLPLAFAHTFGDTARRLARDGGLAFQLIAGIIIAVYASCAITGSERRSGTEAMARSKPVSPSLLFLSRYAGILAALLVFCTTTGIAVILADRIAETFTPETGSRTDLTTASFALLCIPLACLIAALLDAGRIAAFHSSVFCTLPLLLAATAGMTGFHDRAGERTDVFTFTPDPSILPATLLITAALLMFCAIALTLSVRFKPVTVFSSCLAILATGLISEWMIIVNHGRVFPALLWFLALFPDWQRFWSHGTGIPAPVLVATVLYALLYTAAVLSVGCILFEKSESIE